MRTCNKNNQFKKKKMKLLKDQQQELMKMLKFAIFVKKSLRIYILKIKNVKLEIIVIIKLNTEKLHIVYVI